MNHYTLYTDIHILMYISNILLKVLQFCTLQGKRKSCLADFYNVNFMF